MIRCPLRLHLLPPRKQVEHPENVLQTNMGTVRKVAKRLQEAVQLRVLPRQHLSQLNDSRLMDKQVTILAMTGP